LYLLGYKITKRLRELLFKSLLSQETAYFDRHKTGELINRLSSDCLLVSQTVTTNISDGLRSTIMVASGISFMVISFVYQTTILRIIYIMYIMYLVFCVSKISFGWLIHSTSNCCLGCDLRTFYTKDYTICAGVYQLITTHVYCTRLYNGFYSFYKIGF